MIFFDRLAWSKFEQQLAHRHLFDSDLGFMPVGPSHDATLLRCKCGHGQWFFRK